jgi:Spy/CpxP family protein refolding chaperone
MKHQKALTTSLAAVLLVLAMRPPPAAQAEPRHHHAPGSFAALYAERLGLDAEAQAKIQEIVAQSGVRDRELREELDAARQRIHDLMNEVHHPEEAAIMAQAEAIGAVEAEIHKNRLRAILKIREILSPEQRKELLRMHEEEHPHRRPPGHGIEGCRQDLRNLCREEEGRAALSCLDEHWEDLSKACRDAFDLSKDRDPLDRDAP